MARAPLEGWFPTQLLEISYIGEEVEGRVAKGLSDPTRETLTVTLSVTLWRALVRFTPSGPRCCGAWTLAPRVSFAYGVGVSAASRSGPLSAAWAAVCGVAPQMRQAVSG